jgi:hypothetical protein
MFNKEAFLVYVVKYRLFVAMYSRNEVVQII